MVIWRVYLSFFVADELPIKHWKWRNLVIQAIPYTQKYFKKFFSDILFIVMCSAYKKHVVSWKKTCAHYLINIVKFFFFSAKSKILKWI